MCEEVEADAPPPEQDRCDPRSLHGTRHITTSITGGGHWQRSGVRGACMCGTCLCRVLGLGHHKFFFVYQSMMYFTAYHVNYSKESIIAKNNNNRSMLHHPQRVSWFSGHCVANITRRLLHCNTSTTACSTSAAASCSSPHMQTTHKLASLAPQPLFSLFEQVSQVPRPSFHEDRWGLPRVHTFASIITTPAQYPAVAQGLGGCTRPRMAPGQSTQPCHHEARIRWRRARPRCRPTEPR